VFLEKDGIWKNLCGLKLIIDILRWNVLWAIGGKYIHYKFISNFRGGYFCVAGAATQESLRQFSESIDHKENTVTIEIASEFANVRIRIRDLFIYL